MHRYVAREQHPEGQRPHGPERGGLPEWDLSDLYRGPDDPAIAATLAQARAAATAFADAYKGRLAGLTGPALAESVARYERLDETLARIGAYAQLLYAQDMSDPAITAFYQSVGEDINEITALTLFYALELNRIDAEAFAAQAADPALDHYRPWLEGLRIFRPHQLSDAEESLLHEKQVTGRSAWIRLFDETQAALRIPFAGRDHTATEILNLIVDKDPTIRQGAGRALGRALTAEVRVLALITNTLAKDKAIEDKRRGFARPISARNLANRVEDGVVDALIGAVRASYDRLSHRYYLLKARWFGQTQLDWWDRNAPLPQDDDRDLPWSRAREIVLDAYHRFSPDLGALGQRFFDQPWIDAPVRSGKSPGAFAHPCVPSVHPYLLLNYQGKLRDVMTLAHELGHGVHQLLAAGQGHLLADTPLTLAETASVFGEMLTFQALLAAETDPGRRRIMLAAKVEDMLNTVVRQIALHGFEERVHAERAKGELLPDQLGEIWLEQQRASLGPALRFDEDYRHYWGYIPHFVHSPFYVYAYAFGDCLVNSLYAVYQEQPSGFAERYLDLLRAGGRYQHRDLLAPFGLNAADPAFWHKGLGMIAGFIDELERLG